MGKWVHRRIDFDTEAGTFTCSACGTVPLWLKAGKPVCSNAPSSPVRPGIGSGNYERRVAKAVVPPVKASWPKCLNCKYPTQSWTGYCSNSEECRRLGYTVLRYHTFVAYGGAKCACCGETRYERLSLDHVNGDGHLDRKNVIKGGGKGASYAALKASGFPDKHRYQVLCHNCNTEKGVSTHCPCKEPSVLETLMAQGAI